MNPPPAVQMQWQLKELFREHNLLRSDPRSFIPALTERMTNFRQDNMYYSRSNLKLKTREGRYAIEQLIEELTQIKEPMGKLVWSDALHNAADSFAVQLGESAATSLSQPLTTRLDRFVKWSGRISENIQFGYHPPRDLLLTMLIDDGVTVREHRRNILNPAYKFIGIGCHPHRQHQFVTVILYASLLPQQMQPPTQSPVCHCSTM